ncbi:PRC-barrel domain-containing protein [Roseateles violae]|uniref:PRC-barrel domain-containing protein n=1 Tax=Roseateles violae TaxID=3058042 RepID=A0ABT8DWI3_9BURK|nr:PRC-barrel domain-containing protein [Pelomonas sp. PFR6]MDN3920669.1 PRC-barrel domain-containing protein [Pelomonas sp. PFR6]
MSTITGMLANLRADEARSERPGASRGLATAPTNGPGPRLLTASMLKGNKVVNLQDETLGSIEEIMLDVQRGRVAYAVMVSGGFLGIGERFFAVPWAVLTLDPDRQCFVMDAGSDYFDNAPGFDKNHWPSQAQREWHEEIHRHYRIRPYWD